LSGEKIWEKKIWEIPENFPNFPKFLSSQLFLKHGIRITMIKIQF
jgi:hypothetical protein